jgi:spermidine/putrescine transport system permease protein
MTEAGGGWRGLVVVTLAVYLFLFAPLATTALLAFNGSTFGGFPLHGFTLHWFAVLTHNRVVIAAFRTSVLLALATALLSTACGIATAVALVRFEFPGKSWLRTLHMAPILMPETALALGLLLFLHMLSLPRCFALLLLGHVVLSLPYVVLVVQARLSGLTHSYEEAAQSLGATPWQTFREVTLPLLAPAVIAGGLLAFTISFDNITATLFWRPAGIETLPTQIYSMLHTSISPEVNALGMLMIILTTVIPLLGAGGALYFTRVRG